MTRMHAVLAAAALASGAVLVRVDEKDEERRRFLALGDEDDGQPRTANVGSGDLAREPIDLVRDLADAETLPDRVSTHARNRWYDPAVGNMGCRFNGVEQDLVVEACVSGGWVRIGRRNGAGRLVSEGLNDYAGAKHTGEVELYWKTPLSRQVRRARARGKR